jgi:hypothetical protein
MRFLLSVVLIGLTLAACQTNTNQTLPTVQSLPTLASPEATSTPDAAQPTIAPTRNLVRPTLPPTWTTVPTNTDEPTPTEIIPTPTFFNPPVATPVGCGTFQVDFQNSVEKFPIGTPPTVVWVGAGGAVRYRLKLVETLGFGDASRVISEDIYIAETFYTFPADVFEENVIYGWEVYPIDERGDQMCFAVGGVLQAFKPLGQ